MSTKNTTTSSNQYNNASMSAFNAMTPQATSALSGEINDPYSNSAFNTQLARGNRANQVQGDAMQQQIHNSLLAQGIHPGSPLYAQQMAQAARAGMSNQAQMHNNLILNATAMRQNAIGQELNYKPLQTGQTQVEQKSGLGTWLPQLVGAGLGAASMAMGMPGGMGAIAGKFAGGAPMTAQNLAMQGPTNYNPGGYMGSMAPPDIRGNYGSNPFLAQ